MRNVWKKYWQPTPKRLRALGDTLLSIGSVSTGYAIVDGNKPLAIGLLVCTILGKIITNFFSDEKNTNNSNTSSTTTTV